MRSGADDALAPDPAAGDVMAEEPQNTRRVGVYDRPASADRPRALIFSIALAVIGAVAALIYFMRT